MIRLVLNYPPQSNHLMTVARGRKIMAPKYRLWRDLTASVILGQMKGEEPITGPYTMHVVLDRPDRRRRDLSNVGAKAIEDALVAAGVIADDSLAQKIVMEWSGRVGKPAYAEVTLEAL